MHAWPQNDADIAAAQRFRLSHKVLRAHSAFQAASFVLTPQRHEADLLLVGDPAQPAGRVLDLAGLSGRGGGGPPGALRVARECAGDVHSPQAGCWTWRGCQVGGCCVMPVRLLSAASRCLSAAPPQCYTCAPQSKCIVKRYQVCSLVLA